MKAVTHLIRILKDVAPKPKSRARVEVLFDHADDRERCGFEKWLQYELVLQLISKKMSFEIEKQVAVDFRKPQEKQYLQIDLRVKLKSGDTFDVELKVRHVLWRAIRALKADCKKLSKVRKSYRANTSFAVVLCGADISPKYREELEKEFSNLFWIIPVGERVNFIVVQAQG